MNKDKILDEIFANDPLGLLNVKPKVSNTSTADERLLTSFAEINNFITRNGNEPTANISNVSEFMLYSRLKELRTDDDKVKLLKGHDIHAVLVDNKVGETQGEYKTSKEITSIEDMLNDDNLDILSDDTTDIFKFNHTPKDYQRAKSDFVARRKPCENFAKYEPMFKQVQQDIANGKRKLLDFQMGNLKADCYYVHNGVLFYLESFELTRKEHYKQDGTRVREDGRTVCIFENGTLSNMMFRSVSKVLYENGKIVSPNIDQAIESSLNKFNNITDEDKSSGYIYVLKSKSTDKQISSVKNLYKIGYSKTEVQQRIKNAEKEPTYLMAPVIIKGAWKCYNMNIQKFEQLLHNFFGNSCLELDVFDNKGKRHAPREWFIAPLEVIEQAIALIINGEIVNYKYDAENTTIITL